MPASVLAYASACQPCREPQTLKRHPTPQSGTAWAWAWDAWVWSFALVLSSFWTSGYTAMLCCLYRLCQNTKRVRLNRAASKLRDFDGESPPEKPLGPSTLPDMCTPRPGLSRFVKSAASESESWRRQTLLGILLRLRPAWNLPQNPWRPPLILLFFSTVGQPAPLA